MSDTTRWAWQRDFLDWLADNRQYLAYQPHRLVVTPDYIAFSLVGVTPLLRVMVFAFAVNIEVQYRGRRLDQLLGFSMEPAEGPNQYWYCTHCRFVAFEDRLYPDRASLCREHLYQPLLRWLVEVLPDGKWIEITQFVGGGISARQAPYTYWTPSLHFSDFMSQLEMKFELNALVAYEYRGVAGFYYAPLFSAPVALERFIDLNLIR